MAGGEKCRNRWLTQLWTSTGGGGGRWQLSTMETLVQETVEADTSPFISWPPDQQRDFGVGSTANLSLVVSKTPFFFNVLCNKQSLYAFELCSLWSLFMPGYGCPNKLS